MRESKKMIRIFLVGVLCGVIMAAAMTFLFAIPATNDRWRIEITKRGGGTWYFDKNGHLGWAWTVKPVSDKPQQKRVIIPASQANPPSERM